MTTTNREVFHHDPTKTTIPNDGVAKVLDPSTAEEWKVLRYELASFVCEGEYRLGLERILSTYLENLDKQSQPAAWISGFYGSGKSHFVRVLEYLWRDVTFDDGVRSRGLAQLPDDIRDLLAELSTKGKREGGLWSAAGKLGSGRENSVRLTMLSILFRSADLPDQYPAARFVIWLRQNEYYEAVKAGVEAAGKKLNSELLNMYASPYVVQALRKVYPEFADSNAEGRNVLRAQYPPNQADISDDEMVQTMESVMALQSTTPGKLPLTLLVFDELQQFIGEDPTRTLLVQNVVEACCSRFGSRLLFVATGQASLQATTQLSKLRGRFTVNVTLSDTDVERVVREVVLRKAPDKVPLLKTVLEGASGEIDRHLQGTKISPTAADASALLADYPLLPARRRFWERVLRAVDSAGSAGQLRTQLRIVHEAVREIADKPLGTVVAGDVIYNQLKPDMLQSSMLLRDVATRIDQQAMGNTEDGKLRSRLCATIFLINKLPAEGPLVTGLRATANNLADLLVTDLNQGSTSLRQRIPELLQKLVDDGTLMLVNDEYRLQTLESGEWESDYRKRFASISNDDARIASDRASAFQNAVTAALKTVMSLPQGQSKTPRKIGLHFGTEAPTLSSELVPLWVRDEWSTVSEKMVREEAQAAGTDSPVIFVFLPRQEADTLRRKIASFAAADGVMSSRVVPATPEGLEARNAMETRRKAEEMELHALVSRIVENSRVYQGGGNQVTEGSFQASVRQAFEDALVRLFPKFKLADDPKWNSVVKRAGEGAADALTAVNYTGDVDKNPVCQEVRTFLGSAGKRGSDIRKKFGGAGYGWPQDAIDGALLALVAGGFVRATSNGQAVSVKQINQAQIGVIDFINEGVTVNINQRLGIKKLIQDFGLPLKNGEEAQAIPLILQRLIDLAGQAGGDPPLPARPAASIAAIEQLRAMSGNEQFVAVYNQREELSNNFKAWTQATKLVEQRRTQWLVLQRLLKHAGGLVVATQVGPQLNAIQIDRSLLSDPNPVAPLIAKLCDALRLYLQEARQRLNALREQEMTGLQSSEEWGQIDETQRQQFLASNGLENVAELNVGTTEALLTTLDASPISEWGTRYDALPGRVNKVRDEAARYLMPKSVTVRPHRATLKTEFEVDLYLKKLREDIMNHVKAGNPVII